MEPVYDGMQPYNAPSYSFLIGHETSGSKLIFDLGVAKSWRRMMSIEDVKELTESSGISIAVKKDVAEVLEEHRIDPSCITFIVYSQHHYDHVGDPSTFPTSTSIVVGPGFMRAYLTGYPDNPSSEFLYDAEKNKGCEIIELNFDPSTSKHTCLVIGGFEAIDFLGDESFFLLNTLGHTIGHVSALLRTTSDASGKSTFVLLGGDIAHHPSVFRPSYHFPFPEVISTSPFCKPFDAGPSRCFGDVFTQHHYRYHEAYGESLARCTSFAKLASPEEDLAASRRSVEKLTVFDAMENVFAILAHDGSLLDVSELFPKTANDWKTKGLEREESLEVFAAANSEGEGEWKMRACVRRLESFQP